MKITIVDTEVLVWVSDEKPVITDLVTNELVKTTCKTKVKEYYILRYYL